MKDRKFIMGFIIFFIILMILTMLALYFTFDYIDKDVKKVISQYEEKNIKDYEDNIKKEAEDKIYAIKSYSETYNENDLEIDEITDFGVNYIEIQGLKNKKVQNKINKEIKDMAYSFNCDDVYTYLTANFSNILSVESYGVGEEIKTLNFDLVTGEHIPLEKVFVSSAPLNLYLSEALYENLAWNIDYDDVSTDLDILYNMDNRDTSEYEDKFLMFINKFKKEKDNIKYSISPEGVNIYYLAEEFTSKDYFASNLLVNFIEHIEDVAIYKRYLTKESIFEENDRGQKGLIVFTANNFYNESEYFNRLFYGKLTDNIFLEEVVECYENEYNIKNIKEYIQKISKEKKENIKKTIKNNQGAIYQISYSIQKREEGYYQMYILTATATSTKEYFNTKIFKDYAKLQQLKTGEASMKIFNEYNSTKDLEIKNDYEEYFFDLDGKFIGNTEKEANMYVDGE